MKTFLNWLIPTAVVTLFPIMAFAQYGGGWGHP